MSRTVIGISLRSLVAALGLLAALAPSAAGQTAPAADPEARPTRGVYLPAGARAGDADASAVELNPAQLGLLQAPSLALATAIWGPTLPLPGRGAGLLVGVPIFGRSALGFGLSHVGVSDVVGVASHTTLQVAYALRVARGVALGATWAHIWGSTLAGADTFDLGLSARPGRYLAAGLVVEDVGEPRTAGRSGLVFGLPPGAGTPLPRLWAAELVVRPLGTDRFEVAAGAAHADGDRWRALVPRGRLTALVTDGLRLYADAETLPRGAALAFSGGADYRLSLGMAVDFGHLGATVGGRAGVPGVGDAGIGATAVLRVEGDQRPALAAPAVVVRVSLDGIDSDRAYLDLVRRLRGLAAARDVAGVLLKIENVELGLGRIEELRDLVAALRARGKPVYAYAPFPSTRDYYLAVACDGILIHPAGTLSLTGFSQTVTFYKGALDRLGVNVDLVRIGEFKGAAEPLIMTEQSPPVRQNKNALLDDTFHRLVAAIAAARSRRGRLLDEARVRLLIDRGLFTPFEAELMGLIDAVKDESEIEAYLRQALGRSAVTVRDPDPAPPHRSAWPSRRVAVVLVDGAIVDGPSRRLPFDLGAFAGSDTLVAALDKCAKDSSVGAVVLRVNSPGGSAFASDVVARAIGQLRKAGKPVVVSMGDMAASGGYYIAAPADLIYAEPSTISGSIGIFGYKADVRRLMGRLGVTSETYRRGQHADYFSPYRPWTDEEIKLAAEKIRHFYGLFLTTVAEGRRSHGLTLARVDEVGRGHVWTGAQAQGIGLVDRMGGVMAAIDQAALLGNVPLGRDEEPELEVLPRSPTSALQRLIGLAAAAGGGQDDSSAPDGAALIARDIVRAGGGAALRLLAPLIAGGGSGIEARIPYDLEIR